MSCDWDVICITCGERAGIGDANHADDVMRLLVKHRETLALLDKLNKELPPGGTVDLAVDSWGVDVSFFGKHQGEGHELLACTEYGDLDRPCKGTFVCPYGCGVVGCEALDHPRRPNDHWHKISTELPYHYAPRAKGG